MMKAKNILVSAGLMVGSFLTMTTTAEAASFITDFTPNPADPTRDIFLQSIIQNGQTITQFSLVNRANILSFQSANGPASSDRGDNASGVKAETPTNAQVVASLGNNNLNNIIDMEDGIAAAMNVFFEHEIKQDGSGLDSLFFWERGRNSDLQIQAIDSAGNLIGNALTLLRRQQANAGFGIDTTEIGSSQPVGSWGVNLNQLGVTGLSGLRLTVEPGFSGPDFKVVARKTPEPGVMIGLGTVATLAFLRRRAKNTALNSAN
jgi:hypothetical protein